MRALQSDPCPSCELSAEESSLVHSPTQLSQRLGFMGAHSIHLKVRLDALGPLAARKRQGCGRAVHHHPLHTRLRLSLSLSHRTLCFGASDSFHGPCEGSHATPTTTALRRLYSTTTAGLPKAGFILSQPSSELFVCWPVLRQTRHYLAQLRPPQKEKLALPAWAKLQTRPAMHPPTISRPQIGPLLKQLAPVVNSR